MADRTSARLFGELFTKLADVRREVTSKRLAVRPEVKLLNDLILWAWDQTGDYDFSPCQMDCDDALKELGLLRVAGDGADDDDAGYEYGPEEED